jgi:hypothetical protein
MYYVTIYRQRQLTFGVKETEARIMSIDKKKAPGGAFEELN